MVTEVKGQRSERSTFSNCLFSFPSFLLPTHHLLFFFSSFPFSASFLLYFPSIVASLHLFLPPSFLLILMFPLLSFLPSLCPPASLPINIHSLLLFIPVLPYFLPFSHLFPLPFFLPVIPLFFTLCFLSSVLSSFLSLLIPSSLPSFLSSFLPSFLALVCLQGSGSLVFFISSIDCRHPVLPNLCVPGWLDKRLSLPAAPPPSEQHPL